MADRAQFTSKLGVIAATAGSAVGLGNIWRFPYEAGTHGGGAFLLCYILFVFILGVPVICAEFTMGRSSRLGMPGAYRWPDGGHRWDAAGYIAIVAAFMIMSFYSVVAGWTTDYVVDSVGNIFNPSDEVDNHARFESFISGWKGVLWTIIFLVINALVLLGGVEKGIERVSNILMPLLFIILIAFCINSFTMPKFSEGVSFLFHPDFSKLTPETVLGALGQAFFSLSLGMGCLVTYSSYFSDGTPLVKTACQIAFLDTLVAILAGVIIFPAVFSFGMSPAAGPTLVFEVLPDIFSQMTGGAGWSALFFLLLAVASLTSIISVSEIIVAFLTDEFKMSRAGATMLITGISCVTGTLCSLSFGPLAWLNLFNVFDYLSSNILMTAGGLCVSLYAGWKLKPADRLRQLNPDGRVQPWLYNSIVFAIRYIAPAGIVAVFISGLF